MKEAYFSLFEYITKHEHSGYTCTKVERMGDQEPLTAASHQVPATKVVDELHMCMWFTS